MSRKITRIHGVLKLEVEGVPNREGTGELTIKRKNLLGINYSDEGATGKNHVMAKISNDGKSFTSADCINNAIFKEYVPVINSIGDNIDYSLMCTSLFHLLSGNMKIDKDAPEEERFARHKSLKLSNAYDETSGNIFVEHKVNGSNSMTQNGLRTQETAGRRIQVSEVLIDIQNLSKYLMGKGQPTTRHCSVDKESTEKVVKLLREFFTSEGVKDVSNIALGKSVRSKKCVNGIEDTGFLFSKEQILILIKKADELLRSAFKFTTHGSFKAISVTYADQFGREINLEELTPDMIELSHEEVLKEAVYSEPKKKETKKPTKKEKNE